MLLIKKEKKRLISLFCSRRKKNKNKNNKIVKLLERLCVLLNKYGQHCSPREPAKILSFPDKLHVI